MLFQKYFVMLHLLVDSALNFFSTFSVKLLEKFSKMQYICHNNPQISALWNNFRNYSGACLP